MIPEELKQAIQSYWIAQGLSPEILEERSVSGGSINSSLLVKTSDGSFFLKYNSAAKHPQMFASEYAGLELLASSNSIRVPQPLFYHEGQQYSGLLMEFIEENSFEENFWRSFAFQLSQLHQNTRESFGLGFDNYMGSLPQSNTPSSNFVDFFIKNRLLPQLKIARDKYEITSLHIKQSERLFVELHSIFPEEKPALLHGDLWNGNFMSDEGGNPVIMDPAAYFGHREIDVAMTTMFGGFSPLFYQYYHQHHPLEKDWQDRLKYYNLYPVLIHINLFGASYLGSLEAVLDRF
ncbi:fructosamine kinase family protein [Lentimicrobium sp. S6]|uniref:fructosamine kinase family protein n=1 Tax=Lentimicrobium sp. S6 TaxID=2735872 RepID=UPI001554A039|nr:fructosamine kinase family protein [Lentimicrobium sp. S6]NPD47843.1 phosphotransferase [Lentimicrobium sp. S6]